ncbi:MAG TPA: hypothetical protein PKA05_19340 [Roseiflexaceae bacterium]|nr:hypothetical protein [Roseiflexaceae bacterium]HMP42542.1 hypothetical protein [Roseiflexaceae bacterium]
MPSKAQSRREHARLLRRKRRMTGNDSSDVQMMPQGALQHTGSVSRWLDPGNSRQLQQSIGNRALGRFLAGGGQRATPMPAHAPAPIQRYVAINPQDYTMGAGAKFSSQSIDSTGGGSAYVMETTEMSPAGNLNYTREKKGAGGFAQTNAGVGAKPTIKYSSDGASKAIALELTQAEPKVFYATSDVKAASNAKLEQVGSAVRIETAGETLTAPKDPNDPTAGTIALQMMQPASTEKDTHNPLSYKILDKFGEISECNSFIKFIVGNIGERVGVFGQAGNEHEAIVSEEHEPTHEIADFAQNQPTGTASGLAQHLKGTPSGSHDAPLPGGYTGMHNKDTRDRQLGINKGALADVGEGYVTMSNTAMPGGVPFDEYLTGLNKLKAGQALTPAEEKMFTYKWGYHYAGIVARVNNDAISLENYNRGTVMEWELDKHYNDLVHQYQAFRDFVRNFVAAEQVKGNSGEIPSIPKLRRAWYKERAQEWQKAVTDANQQHVAINQQITAAIEKINKTQSEGMAVANARLFHFKMYGDAPGQSFHEQWQGALSDPMTLRIRQSLDALRTASLETLNTKFGVMEQSQELPTGLSQGLGTSKVNLTRRMQQADSNSEISGAMKGAIDYLKDIQQRGIVQLARRVATLAGSSPDKVPAQGTPEAILRMVDKWISKGWAVRKSTKDKLTARRTQQRDLRGKIVTLAALKFD